MSWDLLSWLCSPCQHRAFSVWEGPLAASPSGVTLCSQGGVTAQLGAAEIRCLLPAGAVLEESAGQQGLVCAFRSCLSPFPMLHRPRVFVTSLPSEFSAIMYLRVWAWPLRVCQSHASPSGWCLEKAAPGGSSCCSLSCQCLLAAGLNCCLIAGTAAPAHCCHLSCQPAKTSTSPRKLLCGLERSCCSKLALTLPVLLHL